MFSPEDIQNLNNMSLSEEQVLDLSFGDEQQNSIWERVVNARYTEEGSYRFWKHRNGIKTDDDFSADILTMFDFSVNLEGSLDKYLAVHTKAGHIYLYDIVSESKTIIFNAVFSTSEKVQFVQNGIYLYIFDYDQGAAKYYDLLREEGSDFNGELASHITSFSWTAGKPHAGDTSESDLMYRYYSIISVLPDGSVTFPSRPMMVWGDKDDISGASSIEFDLTFTAGPNVNTSYLIATRWNADREVALQPSTEDLPSGPWFIAQSIKPGATSVTDSTADDNLDNPISELIPLSGGVPTIFTPNQIKPNTVASISNTLIFGGYKVNRAVPDFYSDSANASKKNTFTEIVDNNELAGSLEIACAFQYTDGTFSGIKDSGVLLEDGEKELIEAFNGSAATATIQIDISGDEQLDNDTVITVTEVGGHSASSPSISAGSTAADVGSELETFINGDSSFPFTANHNGGGELIFTYKTVGAAYNGEEVSLADTEPDTGFSPATATFGGGESAEFSVDISGNWLQFQNTNSLISKAWVLAKDGSDYRTIFEIDSNDGRLHGAVIVLPNVAGDITSKPVFTPPDVIQTTVNFDNYVTTSVAFQNIDIRSQQPIADRSRITRVIPEKFDLDKSQLRYRIQVYTERNMQIAYLTTSGDSYNIDVEVLLDDFEVINPRGITRLMDKTFSQTNDGIFVYEQGIKKIVDKNQYPVLSNNLTDVAYHPRHGEYWFIMEDTTVFVWLNTDKLPKQYKFDTPTLPGLYKMRAATYAFGSLRIASGRFLCTADEPGIESDFGETIKAHCITKHLTTPQQQLNIIEVQVTGQNMKATVFIDNQKDRLDSSDAAGWVKEFSKNVNGGEKEVEMYGTSWFFSERAVMPKIQIEFVPGVSFGGFIENMEVKGVRTENKGLARM